MIILQSAFSNVSGSDLAFVYLSAVGVCIILDCGTGLHSKRNPGDDGKNILIILACCLNS